MKLHLLLLLSSYTALESLTWKLQRWSWHICRRAQEKALFVPATTAYSTTRPASSFFEAKTLRLIFTLCALMNFSNACPTSASSEQTATRAILAASFGPPIVISSLRSNLMYVGSAGRLSSASSQPSRRASFSLSDRRIRILASQATSVSEMGLFIQSPLYFTSLNLLLPKRGCLGVNISPRPCCSCCNPSGEVLWWVPLMRPWKIFFMRVFIKSNDWRACDVSPGRRCISNSARIKRSFRKMKIWHQHPTTLRL